jgi:hypothetical protein
VAGGERSRPLDKPACARTVDAPDAETDPSAGRRVLPGPPHATGDAMKIPMTAAVAAAAMAACGLASAQTGPMMNGGMRHGDWMGGYGGYGLPVLLVVVVGLVAWIVMQKRK